MDLGMIFFIIGIILVIAGIITLCIGADVEEFTFLSLVFIGPAAFYIILYVLIDLQKIT